MKILDIPRKLSDEEISTIFQLRMSGESIAAIAFAVGISESEVRTFCKWDTLYQYPKTYRRVKLLAETVKEGLPARQYTLSSQILASITDEDMAKASLKDKVLSHSILVDKARLLSGESTVNIEQIEARKKDIDQDIIDVENELAEINRKLAEGKEVSCLESRSDI